MLRVAIRIAAVGCVVALVVLSWLPKEMEARTGMPGQIEHVVAYLGTGALLGWGWARLRTHRLAAGLIALAAILEIGQIWIPGRTSQLVDLAASAAGALAGLYGGRAVARRTVAWREGGER